MNITWGPKRAQVLVNIEDYFSFEIEGIPVRFQKQKSDEIYIEYPSEQTGGWSPVEQLEDREIVGKLEDRINPEFSGDIGANWSHGWSTKTWKMRLQPSMKTPRTTGSLTKGIWAVHKKYIGICLTHLPSGLLIVQGDMPKKRAKRTAYYLEQTKALVEDEIRPPMVFRLRDWAKFSDDETPDFL